MSFKVNYRFIVYTIIGLFLIPIGIFAQSKGNPFIRKFTPDEYGAHNQVWDITQTQEGFMLISTGTGVVLYDGETFEMVGGEPAMITDLLTSSTGLVYYGGINNTGEIVGSGNDPFFYNKLDGRLDSTDQNYGQIGSIKEVQGDIWITSRKTLFQYTGEHFRSFKPFENEFIFAFNISDTLYVPEVNTGLLKINAQNELEMVHGGETLIGSFFPYFILPYDDHRVLIGTIENGLHLFNLYTSDEASAGTLTKFENEADELLKSAKALVAIQLKNGNYAIGTSNAGVIILKPNGSIDQIIDQKSGLQIETINGLYEDRSGNLWISTNMGFALAEISSPIDYFNDQNGLEGTSLVVDGIGDDIYVSTTLGLYKKEGRNFVKNDQISALTFDIAPFRDPIQSDREKVLAANQFGLYLVDDENTRKLSELFTSAVIQSTQNPNRIFIGTPNSVYSIDYINGQFQSPSEQIIIGNPARQFLEDDRGGIWVATQSDGIRYFPDEFSKEGMIEFRMGEGYSVLMNSTLQWIDGRLFVTTINDIFEFDYDSNTFKPWRNPALQEEEHLGIYRFHHQNGSVWAGSSIQRDKITEYEGFFTDQPIKIEAPYRAIPTTVSLWITEIVGDIWFTSALGLYRYRPESMHENRKIETIFIRQIDIISDSTRVIHPSMDSEFNEPFSNSRYRFTVAAPWYDTSGEIEYRFQLEGLDPVWSTWGFSNTVEYTSLREGTYSFLVQARNRDGIESEVIRYRIGIDPPWFRTYWAYFLYFFGVIFSIMVISKYWTSVRTRNLEAFNEKLEQQVRERSEEIRRQNQKLLELNQEKDDFMNIAVHDLRNPLTGVQGISSMMIEIQEAPTIETIRNYGEIIHNSSKRMFELIDTYLNAHRIDQGDVRASLETVSLKEISKLTLNSFTQQARHKQMSVEVTSTVEDVQVLADVALTQQVLENLISNAIKYSPIGSKISINLDRNSEFGIVRVTDQGPGIPLEKQSELFQKFSKIGTVPTGDEISIGLGLSIAKQLTDMMGGEITCESEPGKGATFTVLLRLAD